MLEALRRLWWLELLIVTIALVAISRMWGPAPSPPAPDSGQPLVLRFLVDDRQGQPVPGLRIHVWHPDSSMEARPRAFEGVLLTSADGEATLYSAMPGQEDRRILYAVELPSGGFLQGALRLPERPGIREFQGPHLLTVEQDRNGLMWRAEVRLTLP